MGNNKKLCWKILKLAKLGKENITHNDSDPMDWTWSYGLNQLKLSNKMIKSIAYAVEKRQFI